MDFLSTLSIGCLVNFLMTTSLTKADFVWARSTKMQLKYLVKFLLRQSDVMLRIVKLITSFTVMRCVPYHVPKAHLTSKGNHTHEVHIKFRLRNTSLKKDGYFRNRLFSVFRAQNDNLLNHAEGVYGIKALALYIINSARNCISSTQSVVYHQADKNTR